MKKSFKLALLGCASSCLINTAYANTHGGLEFSVEPDIDGASCGAATRTYLYTVTNTGFKKIKIKNIEIDINEGDDYPKNDEIVELSDGPNEAAPNLCTNWQTLFPFQSCTVSVDVEPTEIPCPTNNIVLDGEIERSLEVSYKTYDDHEVSGDHRSISSDIDFDISILGSANEYAVLADYVTVVSDLTPRAQSLTQIDGGSVSGADFVINGTSLLFIHPDEDSVQPYSVSKPAFLDAAAAQATLIAAALGNAVDCSTTVQNANFNTGDTTITSGFYCVEGTNFTNTAITGDETYTFANTITFSADKDDLFVFVMPPTAFTNTISLADGADYVLDGVDPDNIFWIFNGDATVDNGVRFAGHIITGFDINPAGTLTDAAGAPYFKGSLLGLSDKEPDLGDPTDCSGDPETESCITLQGYTIDND